MESLLVVYAMVEYFRTQPYTTTYGSMPPSTTQETWRNFETLADKYGITALGEFAKANFNRTVEFTKQDLGFYDMVAKVYEDTISDELKNLVADLASLRAEFEVSRDLADLMLAIPEFAEDVTEYLRGVRVHDGRHPVTMEKLPMPSQSNQNFPREKFNSSPSGCPRNKDVMDECGFDTESEAAIDEALRWIRDHGSFRDGTEPDYELLKRQSMGF